MKTTLASLSLSIIFGMLTVTALPAQHLGDEPVKIPANAKVGLDLSFANVDRISVGSLGTITVSFSESEKSLIKFGQSFVAVLPKSDRQNLIYQMLLHAHFSGSTVSVGTQQEKEVGTVIVDAIVEEDQE